VGSLSTLVHTCIVRSVAGDGCSGRVCVLMLQG
jgi:hypothetical protein